MAGHHLAGRVKLRCAVATKQDDAAIRRLLRNNPMRGEVTLSLEREPCYFDGANIGEAQDETILVFSDETLACIGRCSFRSRWLNGTATKVGYLAELRLDQNAKNRIDILRAGFRFFHELHHPSACPYFTSIAADNLRARRFLEKGGRGLPLYKFLSEFTTLLIGAPKRRGRKSLILSPAKTEQIGDIVRLLNEHGCRNQLACEWTEARLAALQEHQLPMNRFFLLEESGQLVGCAALWDQRKFRQTVIRGYSPKLSALRPLVNWAGGVLRTPNLPPVNSVLRQAFLCPFALTAEKEILLPEVLSSLFPVASELGVDYITLGLPASDPRLPQLQNQFITRSYASRLYSVEWPGDPACQWNVDQDYFPEIALL